MTKQNYSCENSDSCSLMSVTGISTASRSSTDTNSHKKSSTSTSTKCLSSSSCSSSTGSSSCSTSSSSCSTGSSSCSTGSSSSSCSNSSYEPTYTDNSTTTCTNTKKSSSDNSSCYDSSSSSNECKTISSDKCENVCDKKCQRLVKKYNCAKQELLAISDIIVVLNFIKNKLQAVQPNIDLRHVEKYAVFDNIAWLECFVDTLFCVLRKNEAYKVIRIKDCKLKNDEEVVSNRTYLIRVKYNGKDGETCRNIPLVFQWSQLTNNDAKSYKGVLDYVIHDIDMYIKGYQAAGTVPFLC